MHTTTETKTHNHHRPHQKTRAPKAIRQPAWRPQTVGLSRDELRRIVLDQLG